MSWNGSNAGAARAAGTRGARGANPRRGDAAGRGASGGGGLRVALGVVLCAAVLGGAWWWYFGGGASMRRPSADRHKAKPTAMKPAPRQQRRGGERSKPAEPKAAPAEKPKREMYLGKEVVSHTYVTNSTGRSVREVIVTADGMKHGKTTVIAKPTFKYGTDQMLSDVLFPPEHGQMAPWPEMDAKALDREFAKSLLDPIDILDDDPEDVRIRKEAVRQARSEMAQLVKEGYSVLEIIQRQRDDNEHAHEMQLAVSRELHRLRREGASPAEIRDYLDRSNQLLEERGVGPVAEPEMKGRRR